MAVVADSIEIDIGPQRLKGLLGVPADATGLVIFAHGSGSGRLSPRNNRVAAALRDGGLATLLLDLLTPAGEDNPANGFGIPPPPMGRPPRPSRRICRSAISGRAPAPPPRWPPPGCRARRSRRSCRAADARIWRAMPCRRASR